MRPELTSALHFVHGDGAADTVRRAGAPPAAVHVRKDLLTVGPSDDDPARHRALRAAYWEMAREPAAALDHPSGVAAASTAPVALWATPAWSDQLWLWWTLDALGRAGVDAGRLWLAEPRSLEHPLASVGGVSVKAAAAAFDCAAPVTDAQLCEGAALWLKYAASSPLGFDEARRAGSVNYPELPTSAEVHGDWFPRRVDGRLRLAELDALVLSTLAEEWRTPAELLTADGGSEISERLFMPFGDRFFLRRLREWAERGMARSEPRPGSTPFESIAYRIEPAGRQLVDDGLDSVADAPPLYVGGCLVNDPRSPWVRVSDGDGWRLERG
ncbi:MAG: hypothetical protein JWN44_2381 [Myxococcales bacterium]|nr:hypothetical protein [Myxococcales bacterium]